jgi:VanZ family protein
MSRSTAHAVFFFLCIALWTVALLMPVPKNSASKVLGGESGMHLFGKTLHVSAYAFLTLLGGSMNLARRQRCLLLGALSFHAFATEFLQQFVDRGASWRDVGLDHAGIAIGLAIGWAWWRSLFPRPSDTAA